MASDPTTDNDKPKDRAWVANVLIELLDTARRSQEPDIAACGKIADLLLKVLPGNLSKSEREQELDEIKQRIRDNANADPK